MNPVLETERLVLRAPDPRDREAFLDFAATDRAHYIGGPMTGHPAETAWASEIAHWSMHGFGRFAVVPKGGDVAVGLIGPQAAMGWPENELVWYMFANGTGFGYATEAGIAAKDWAFATMKWPSMSSYVEEANTRSIRLAERLGGVRAERSPVQAKGVAVFRFTPKEAAA